VFCRNVLIYFGQETKIDVLDRIASIMPPDGYLLLGAAETVVGLSAAFTLLPDKRGLYALNLGSVAAKLVPGIAVERPALWSRTRVNSGRP